MSNKVHIDAIMDTMTPEHAGSVLRSELWWTVVPKNEDLDDVERLDVFWSIVDRLLSAGIPLQFVDKQPSNDPAKLVESLIRPNHRVEENATQCWTERATLAGIDPQEFIKQRQAAIEASKKEEERRAAQKRKEILSYRNNYNYIEDIYIPLERVEKARDSILKKLAVNPRVPDSIFSSEKMLWDDELKRLSQ